jgi:hypothetical protein
MALVWADGFDHYGTSQALALSSGYAYFTISGIDNANPRTGPKCCKITTSNFEAVRRILDTARATVGVGCGIRWDTAPTSYNGIRFEYGSSNLICRVGLNANLQIVVVGADNNTVLGYTNANAVALGSWAWLEAKVTVGVSGTIVVRLNGLTVLTINNVNIGTNNIDSICLGNPASGAASQTWYFDDLVIWDTSGTDNNDFLGDRRCVTMFPNSNSATQQWTAVGAANAWDCIDDASADTVTYIEAATAGNVSEFGKTTLTTLTTGVAGIRLVAYAQKSDVGTSTFRVGVNSNGFVQNSAEIAPGTAWGYFSYIAERDPNGSIPWVKASVEGAAFRVTRVS